MKISLSLIVAVAFLSGCASVKTASNVKMISFDGRPSESLKTMGNVEGKDCTWSLFGYPLGSEPTVRSAFQNTVQQREEVMPLQSRKKEGAQGNLSAIRNVAVEPSGFGAWIVSRRCLNVTGVGYGHE